MIKASVVIPTYRRPELLLKCLQALNQQHLRVSEFEIIVVSDGPDATTAGALSNWQDKPVNLKYLNLPHRKGPAAARNFGWQHAEAPFIAFTDDDTLPHPEWLNSYLTAWHNLPLAAFTGTVSVPVSLNPTDNELNTAGLATADFVTANCACTKQALQLVNGFDERFARAWREDSDLHFKLLKAKVPLLKIDNAIVVHPVRAARWAVSIAEQSKTQFNALLYRNHRELYDTHIKAAPPLRYYVIVLSAFLSLIALLSHYELAALLLLICCLFFIAGFTLDRLARTSRSASHVLEMAYTSAVIPFASIYWHFRGLWKYKVWFV